MKMIRIKRDNMVERLHQNGTIVKFHDTTVDKRLVGHIIATIVTLYTCYAVSFDKQMTNTITRTGPDVV